MLNIVKIYDKKINFITLNNSGEIIKKEEKELFYTTYEQIKNIFPDNFEPAAIYFSFPEYYFIPIGIENSNCITIALVSDWNLNFLHLKETIKVFDFILTDSKGVNTFKNHGFDNVFYFPLFGLQVDSYKNFITNNKKYDISFIGNLNDNIQIERAKYLYKIAQLSYKYNVFITSNVYGDEYKQIMSESKIVFNFAIRGELNIRVFESMNANSLLFLEEGNLEYYNFIKPNYHFIQYNFDNLHEKLDYYLENTHVREEIIINANNFIEKHNQNWFELNLYNILFKKPFKDKLKEKKASKKSSLINIFDQKILIGAINSVNVDILNIIFDENYKSLINDTKSSNLYLSASYLNNSDIKNLIEYFNFYIKNYPMFIPLKVNLIKILIEVNDIYDAEILLNKLIQELETNAYLIENLSGFFINEIYTRFRIEYEKYISEKNIEKIQKTILWLLYKIKADISQSQELKINSLEKADNIFESIETKIKLGDLYYNNNHKKSYLYYLKALEINPFNLELIYKLDEISDILNIELKDREYLNIIESSPIFLDLKNEIKNYEIKNIKNKISIIKNHSNDKKVVNYNIKNMPEKIPSEANIIFDLADIYFNNNEYKKSLDLYIKYMQIKGKKDSNALNLIKKCLEKLGDYETIKKLNLN